MTTSDPKPKDVISKSTIGTDEDAVCGRGDPPCEGKLTFKEVKNCSCHINPPCPACSESWLECDECGWDQEEEE